MGDRNYRKGVVSLSDRREKKNQELAATGTEDTGTIDLLPSLRNLGPLAAQVPPSAGGGIGFSIPDRLRRR